MFTQWTIPFVLRPKYFILPSHIFHFLRLLNQILIFQSCHGEVLAVEDIEGYHLDMCIGKPAQVTYKPELLFNRPALMTYGSMKARPCICPVDSGYCEIWMRNLPTSQKV